MPQHTDPQQAQRLKLAALVLPAVVAMVTSTLPVALTGYFTLRSSKDDSESGYKTMVEAVKELRKAVSDQALDIAELRGQLKGFQGGFGASRVRNSHPECAADANCPNGFVCREGRCSKRSLVVEHLMVEPSLPALDEVEPSRKFKPLPESLSEARTAQQVSK